MLLTNQKIMLADVSKTPRFGVKGPQAQTWLAALGFDLPARANSWLSTEKNLYLRLGASEFLIEANTDDTGIKLITDAAKIKVLGVYPVARSDASFLLSGNIVTTLLSEICALNLREEPYSNPLYMTQIAGISGTLLKLPTANQDTYRLWCDSTYQYYMYETLATIANSLGDLELTISN